MRWETENYIVIFPTLKKLQKKINIQSKVDIAMYDTFNAIIQDIMVMSFLLLMELENIITTSYYHTLKYHNI
jgi:hypothetical protein